MIAHLIAEIPAAPLVVEIPWAVIGLGVVCAYIAVYGLKYSYHHTLGYMLEQLARVLDVRVWKFSLGVADNIRKLNDKIEGALGDLLVHTETVLGKWWEGQEKIARWTWDA